MKTVRVILSSAEVTQALVEFAYDKSGRTADVRTGPVSVMAVFKQTEDGGAIIEQVRVEMELPE